MSLPAIPVCDQSDQIDATTHIVLHHPTDWAASVFRFDTVQQARMFQQDGRLSGYRVACVCFFDTHPAEMENVS